MMDRQLTHLVRLIDDLLDVSRVSRGRIDLRRARMRLQDAISAAIEASKPLIEASGHELTLDVPADPLWLDGDLTRLAQVVSNLLNNAAKYTAEGGQIALSVARRGHVADITVSDNGLGIDAAMLPRVFELFAQSDQHLERAQGGLGIGLALVSKLVEMHGGSTRAASEGVGRGSQFIVSLPLASGEGEAPEAAQAGEGGAASLHVLVVDDNVDSAQTTRWMLELNGHIPSVAHDGPTALAEAKRLKPDVILLDIGMPGMDGYEVCRRLRAMPETQGAVIIAQTGWGQESDRQKAFGAGFDHHITKPISLDALNALLAQVKV